MGYLGRVFSMSWSDNTIFSVIGNIITVGASQIYGITLLPGQNTLYVQYLSGNTIYVGGATTTVGVGYLWDVSNIKSLSFEDFSGTLYIAAGVTAQFSVMVGRRPGFGP